MPNRSSAGRPQRDQTEAAFAVLRRVNDLADGELTDAGKRIGELERLCTEILEFARVATLPERVIVALDNAAHGKPVGGSVLPILPTELAAERPAVALGRAGGLKGGKARADALSSRRRQEIARKAAVSRWNKSK